MECDNLCVRMGAHNANIHSFKVRVAVPWNELSSEYFNQVDNFNENTWQNHMGVPLKYTVIIIGLHSKHFAYVNYFAYVKPLNTEMWNLEIKLNEEFIGVCFNFRHNDNLFVYLESKSIAMKSNCLTTNSKALCKICLSPSLT